MAALLPQPIQFGKYTLFERIGRGGMADVFKGRIQGPAGFERVFVVKRILPHLSDEPTFIKMFVEEAKLSARLNHPNIVQIFELGSVEDEYFISMEYIRGRDLADTMRAIWSRMGPPRPELVAYIGREACRALSYAHNVTDDTGNRLGMIHRDVSPSNVMLSYEGAVKLLDFGIAKALGEAPETTKSGTMKGKYAYMAPEQTDSGDEVDHRIDIFACGIVLHEVLTGRRLFKGSNDVQTIERVRKCEVPPPSRQNPMCPPELDAIVLKALSRNRDDRFGSAADMADALDDVVHAARFQPSHLAQLVHDLFPLDGGSPPERRVASAGSASHITGSGVPSSAPRSPSPTVPPVARPSTASGVSRSAPAPDVVAVDLTLKPKLAWKPAAAGLLVVTIVGFVFWKGSLTQRTPDLASGVAASGHERPPPPPRRVKISVTSEPDGADVFVAGGIDSIGQTPITFPLDLSSVHSVSLVLRKRGFEDWKQQIESDRPITITLRKKVAEGEAEKARPLAPAASPSVKTVRPKPKVVKRPTTKAKGELVDPF